jgi:hypothetical protein
MKLQLRDTAVLVGTSPDGKCVYSASIGLGEYWDGEHPWDSDAQVVALRLARLQGFLFGGDGQLLQQFESCFNIEMGGSFLRGRFTKMAPERPGRVGSNNSSSESRAWVPRSGR